MRIDHLELENFRGLAGLSLDFRDYQTTVLIGVNGCGKSSILHALALTLSWLLPVSDFSDWRERLERDREEGKPVGARWEFLASDIRADADASRVVVSLNWNGMHDTFAVDAKRSVTGRPELSYPGGHQVYGRLATAMRGEQDEPLPVIVYYPVNRFVASTLDESPYDRSHNVLAAYDDSLIAGPISFQRFFEWYRVREDVENEMLRWKRTTPEKDEDLNGDTSGLDPQLEAARQAIYSLLFGDFSSLRVERTPRPRMSILKQGTKMFLDQLSDGEKCLLAMSGDLARRMAIANPRLAKPLESPGVVLIDEVDLHLHPGWQRKVIPALEKTFPNCQFIVTTHSPQVLSGPKNALVCLLVQENGTIRALRYESPFGRDSNWILEEVMADEDRPPETKEKVTRYLELIDDYRMDEARKLEAEPAQELGTDYPQLVEGRARTRRKEILGKCSLLRRGTNPNPSPIGKHSRTKTGNHGTGTYAAVRRETCTAPSLRNKEVSVAIADLGSEDRRVTWSTCSRRGSVARKRSWITETCLHHATVAQEKPWTRNATNHLMKNGLS